MAQGVPRFSRISGFGPLPELLAREGVGARLFHHRGLDLPSLDPLTPIPFALMNAIFERAARLAGDDLLGARVGAGMAPEDFGPFIDFILAAETVGGMIQRQTVLATVQSNAPFWRLTVHDGRAWWRLSYPSDAGQPLVQHALHFLPTMIEGLRRYVGADVTTAEAHVPGLAAAGARRLNEMLRVAVRQGREEMALVFPADWLDRWKPITAPVTATTETMPQYIDRPLPRTMVEAIQADFTLRREEAPLGLGAVARELGASRRTIQRLLDAEGVSYRDLLRHARMERARALLTDTRQSIAEIALRSGYSDQSNFHRAFTASTGMTPRRFRQALQSAAPVSMGRSDASGQGEPPRATGGLHRSKATLMSPERAAFFSAS